MNSKNKKIKAYNINEDYYLLTNQNIKAVYSIQDKNYYVFNYEDELPKEIKKEILKGNELYDSLRYAKVNETSKQVDLNLIDNERLTKFELEEFKPNINYEYTTQTKKLVEIKKQIEKYYKIVVNEENTEQKYYYDYLSKKYEPLSIFKLGVLLEDDFNITLTKRDVTTLYGMFRKVKTPNSNAIAFNNCTLNTKTFERLDNDVFTVKRIDYNYLPLDKCKKNTLVEQTLKKVFIPANKPNNDDYYNDFLERLGASFKAVNKHKMIYLLTGSGDDGKGIVLKILQLVHGRLAVIVKPKNLKDNFYSINLSDTNVILMDELNKNSFDKEVVGILKDITGRGASDSRIMHSQETEKVKNYGVIFIATNTVPEVPYSDSAYWERLILIKLPNKFKEDIKHDNLANNIYIANNDLHFLLEDDKEGIEWLISASIEAYKKRENGFTIKQNALKTQFIYDGKNPINIFLNNYIVQSNNLDDNISIKEIKYCLLNWCIKNNITSSALDVHTPRELNQEIGYKLKNKYKNLESAGKKDNSIKYVKMYLDIDYDYDNIKFDLKDLEDQFF